MSQFLLLEGVLLIVSLLAVARVWRASTLDGILTLVVPFYAFVALVKYRNDADHDIRWHMLVLVCGGIVGIWLQQRLIHDYAAQQAALQAEVRQHAAADDSDDEEDSEQAPLNTTTPQATIEFDRAERLAQRGARQPDAPVAAPTEGARSREPEQASGFAASDRSRDEAGARTTAAVAPPALRQALAAATFQRGRFERAGAGATLDLPSRFHALAGVDARRIGASLGREPDPHEIAWVLHESVALDAPASWHVSVRWLADGWVASSGTALDAAHLLHAAQHGAAAPQRLAGSGGDLIGYAVAPSIAAGVTDWVEERLPLGASASVLDCHAVRPGRKGVLEFSAIGMPPGSQALCHASVRLLARRAHFDPGDEYPDEDRQSGDLRAAPYRLEELVAQVR